MDALEQLKQDVNDGRIDRDRLVELVGILLRKLQESDAGHQETKALLEAALQRIAELEKKLGGGTAKFDKPFSTRAEEKRQEERGNKPKKSKLSRNGRRGRLNNSDKIKLAERTEKVYPEGVAHDDCAWSHTRPMWRLEDGRAVLIAYEIYRGPGSRYGKIPGAMGRSEFGMEIVVELSHLVYVMGLSFDKACALLSFFQKLTLSKSQAESLLNQLARRWKNEFEVLCTLLANSAIVNADETSWSIHSVWAFLSEKARVILYGVHKDADTLAKILDPSTFAGLVISDDAAVYGHFTASQKCWAHLLRKAIKLTLAEPDNAVYREFTDRLLAIYRKACRVRLDGRLNDAGRARKVAELDDELLELCFPMWSAESPPLEGVADDYRLLTNEIMRLQLAKQLFTFVTTASAPQPNGKIKPASGTNNEAEQKLRGPAQARKTGRTNKTLYGARRQTIIASVLESLRLYLRTFTLETVVAEIERWNRAGQSCFTKLLNKMKLKVPEEPVLDRVIPLIPVPDG